MKAADILMSLAGDLTTVGVAALMALSGSLYVALTIHGLVSVSDRD
ncbi:hypothetical protein [Agrobacterium tumefaciens]|nr:hypothetical protein [Agrobacterium tumefaciens]